MKKKLAVLLAAALTLGMTACGASKGAGDTGKSEKGMVYAVEAGSARYPWRRSCKRKGISVQFRFVPGRCPDGSCFRYIRCSNH